MIEEKKNMIFSHTFSVYQDIVINLKVHFSNQVKIVLYDFFRMKLNEVESIKI